MCLIVMKLMAQLCRLRCVSVALCVCVASVCEFCRVGSKRRHAFTDPECVCVCVCWGWWCHGWCHRGGSWIDSSVCVCVCLLWKLEARGNTFPPEHSSGNTVCVCVCVCVCAVETQGPWQHIPSWMVVLWIAGLSQRELQDTHTHRLTYYVIM